MMWFDHSRFANGRSELVLTILFEANFTKDMLLLQLYEWLTITSFTFTQIQFADLFFERKLFSNLFFGNTTRHYADGVN